MSESKQTKPINRKKLILWLLLGTFVILCIISAFDLQNKKGKPTDNGKFIVDEKYAQALCATESNFPSIDWSQNEMISKTPNEWLIKDQYRLKEDETKPVYYYHWNAYSNLYGKNRGMDCYFITDMDTHKSEILWLHYADLETGTGNIDVIGSYQELLEIAK